jgi:hypothetical protein
VVGVALVAASSLAGGALAALLMNALHHFHHYVAYFLPVGLAALFYQIVDAASDWRKKQIVKALGRADADG